MLVFQFKFRVGIELSSTWFSLRNLDDRLTRLSFSFAIRKFS